MWGMSLIDQMVCRIQYRRATYEGMYTPPRTDRTVQYPGYNGGTDWGGVAVDPIRGVIVANYNNMPNYVRLVPRKEADKRGWAPRSEARGGSMSQGSEGAGEGSSGGSDASAAWCSLSSSSVKKPIGEPARLRKRTALGNSAAIFSAASGGTSACSICAGSGRWSPSWRGSRSALNTSCSGESPRARQRRGRRAARGASWPASRAARAASLGRSARTPRSAASGRRAW